MSADTHTWNYGGPLAPKWRSIDPWEMNSLIRSGFNGCNNFVVVDEYNDTEGNKILELQHITQSDYTMKVKVS